MGFETFATYRFQEYERCWTSDARSGVGPMAQLAIINLDEPRLTIGIQGGGELSRGGLALSGELGGTYHFGQRSGFDIHTGFNVCAGLAGLEWQNAAQFECASILAFLGLAAELLAHEAPDALVAAALRAAEDEIAHAVISAALASRYLGARVWPILPDVLPRPPLAGPAGLTRLATESWLDGCLGEGMAAERTLVASRLAVEPRARTAQCTIACDEARHAELGWNVLRWATAVGGDDVRDAVYALRDAEPSAAAQQRANAEHDGCLGPSRIDQVSERHCARGRRRLDVLASSHAGA